MNTALTEFSLIVWRAAKRDRIPLGIAAVVWVVCAWLLTSKGIDAIRTRSITDNLTMYAITIAGLVLGKVVAVTIADRPEYPVRHAYKRLLADGWPERLASNTPMLIALAVFMPIYSAMKSAIPLFTEFDWDQTFIAWDIAVHGTDPWRLLQPLLGYPSVTFVLSLLYQVWLLLIYFGSVFFCLFARNERLRLRYLTSSFLMWSILGIAGAQYFASVGPCFLLTMKGDPAFIELMGYLYTVDEERILVSLRVQELLFTIQSVGSHELGSGISAMPSMHVALAVLVAIAMWEQRPILGWIFGIYAAIIMITSVHVGFHYAVDGYISFVAVIAIWCFSGFLIKDDTSARSPSAAGAVV